MRPILPLLLMGSLLLATPAVGMRRGDSFPLGASRSEVERSIADRGLNILTSSPAHLTSEGPAPAVEFELYDFVPVSGGEMRLWRVTVAYRVPYTRGDFDSVRSDLEDRLGAPAQVFEPAAEEVGADHRVVWADAKASVLLAARWPERPDPTADRMLVTWTDRRLQKVAQAQQRPADPKRKR